MDVITPTRPSGGGLLAASKLKRMNDSLDSTPAQQMQRARQQDFAATLNRASELRTDEKPTEEQIYSKAREAAQDFVAIAFVMPILKQLRESNKAAPPFGPGPGEKQFRSMADAQTAQQIVRGANFPIVDRIASDIAKVKGRVQPGSPADIRLHSRVDVIEGTEP